MRLTNPVIPNVYAGQTRDGNPRKEPLDVSEVTVETETSGGRVEVSYIPPISQSQVLENTSGYDNSQVFERVPFEEQAPSYNRQGQEERNASSTYGSLSVYA